VKSFLKKEFRFFVFKKRPMEALLKTVKNQMALKKVGTKSWKKLLKIYKLA
jgi:hypothetical protein